MVFRERIALSLISLTGSEFSHLTGKSGKENLQKSLPVNTGVVRRIYKK